MKIHFSGLETRKKKNQVLEALTKPAQTQEPHWKLLVAGSRPRHTDTAPRQTHSLPLVPHPPRPFLEYSCGSPFPVEGVALPEPRSNQLEVCSSSFPLPGETKRYIRLVMTEVVQRPTDTSTLTGRQPNITHTWEDLQATFAKAEGRRALSNL